MKTEDKLFVMVVLISLVLIIFVSVVIDNRERIELLEQVTYEQG